ncbi:phage integrase N-terminal domain-containing protein [Plasticicumulans acidivorans]|uniref:Integrase-like protein n=1 Tax=Plasticicumulans acidivorans TaxID=886464 RepID=A0A317MV90_9GAMM|nr:phage integrase N-terminal domain-containing protein [Plasticicumulans acidivorans]PWV58319.1 integrase-like protein [Plasticicumulans acidivorans]
MQDLQFDLKCLCDRNRDGSFSTQNARRRNLDLIARELHTLGFRHLRATGLKPKHVERLVAQWQTGGIAVATIKNRMAHLRWWAEKTGRTFVIPRDNTQLGIPDRVYVTNENKAVVLNDAALAQIKNDYVLASLALQAAFGLRREESIKFIPGYADRGDHIALKDTWCKGGRARQVPILTQEQSEALAQAKRVAGSGSLIPSERHYVQQLKVYERETAAVGLHRLHGLRHRYAQARYQALTGWAAPAAGGPQAAELNPQQRAIDRSARLQISAELGHEREAITALYLGR